jgi:plastocyanin
MSIPAKVAVVLSLAVALAACEGQGRDGVVHEVHIRAMTFEPAALDARPGDTVVWINDDFLPHTATSKSGAWDSGEIAPGASWRLAVGEDGAGDYLCTFHPMMTGTLAQDP